MSAKKTIIVGAGPGGLAAGMLLSSKGYKVEIFEKQSVVGGRTSRLSIGAYNFDIGATFFMMPQLLQELFQEAGRDLHDYVTLKRVDPLYTLQFGETSFSPRDNREDMLAEMNRVFPGESAGFNAFMEKEGEKFVKVIKLLQRPFLHKRTYVSKDALTALPKLDMFQTVYSKLSSYFNDERLKYAFSFQAKYLGMSPWKCPGTFTILSYLEHKFGLYHPIGGVNQLCEAMKTIIEENGGYVHLNKPVKRIRIDKKTATGIELDDGSVHEADDVVINADYSYSVQHLFDGNIQEKLRRQIEKKKYSCSTFMLYLGINKELNLDHHTVVFSNDYKKNVEEMTEQQILSADPSVYIHNPAKLDSTTAPAGKSAVYMLMPVPNTASGIDWEREKAGLRKQMIEMLKKQAGDADLEANIEAEHIITPNDWEAMHVYHGAVFNLAHSLDQMMYLRPHNQLKEIDHCFLTGGGTHPGSGLPTIFQSAKISTDLLVKQYERKSNIVSLKAEQVSS